MIETLYRYAFEALRHTRFFSFAKKKGPTNDPSAERFQTLSARIETGTGRSCHLRPVHAYDSMLSKTGVFFAVASTPHAIHSAVYCQQMSVKDLQQPCGIEHVPVRFICALTRIERLFPGKNPPGGFRYGFACYQTLGLSSEHHKFKL